MTKERIIGRLGDYIKEYSVRNKEGEDIPVYSVTNSNGFCTEYFDKEVASKDQSNYKIVPRGYFAYNPSRINVGSIDYQKEQDKVVVSPLYVVFSVDERIDKDYLLYYLKSEIGQTYIRELASGSVRANLKFSILQDFPIPMVPLDTQKEYVKRLKKIDSILEICDEMERVLEDTVQARFVEMFGGQYTEVKLSEVASVTGGLTKNSKRNQLPMKLPYLRVANVAYISVDVTDMLEIGLTEEEKEKTLLRNEDLLFVEGNGSQDQIGRVAVWHDEIVPCVHQNHLIKVRLNRELITPEYALYYYMSEKGRKQIKKKAVSTSGLYTLSVSKVADFLLPLPDIAMQKNFSIFVKQFDKSKVLVKEIKQKNEILRAALLQEYF